MTDMKIRAFRDWANVLKHLVGGRSSSSTLQLSYVTNNYFIKWNSSTFRINYFIVSTKSCITRGSGDAWSDDLLTYKEILGSQLRECYYETLSVSKG